jgi:serine acetyltransferase/glycosyltransferase involved in cell wall biosynthesis
MTTHPSTVLIISFAFHPSNEIGARRATALARYLAERGTRVVVVSAFGYEPVAPGSEIFPRVIAVPVKPPKRPWLDLLVAVKRRVSSRREDGAGLHARLTPNGPGPEALRASLRARLHERYFRVVYFIDYFKKWSWQAAGVAIRAGREHRAALILASAPPHSTLLAGSWAARRLGIPFVADMRDPWSDVVAVTHPNRRIELRLLRALEGWIMRHAAAVISTSATAAALLVERDSTLAGRIHVIRNGYDGDVAPPLVRTGGRLSILFAGFLYLRRTPYPLLAALERLLSRPDVDPSRVQLTFMGDQEGTFSDQLLTRWLQGKRCAAVVRILPPQSAEAVAQEVAQATVLLNLAQQQRLQVPAKTFEQLASGREVLLICEEDCETANVAAGIRGVTRVDQSDSQLLDAVLLDLYERHAVAGTACVPAEADVRHFSRALANERFAATLDAVVPLTAAHAVSSAARGLVPSSPPGDAARHAPATFAPAHSPLARHLAADIRFYRGLTRGGHTGVVSLVTTMLVNRGLWLLTFHRVANFCLRRRNVRSPLWWLARVCKSIGTCFNVVLCRSQVSEDCEIGGGAYLANQGFILCGARSIGAGSLIHDRCTFGYTVADGVEGRPAIGRNVWIGPNCIIAGSLTVGDGATILPGSFVTFDVPPRTVVKGNPALVVRRNFDNSTLRSSLTVVTDVGTHDS